MYPKFEYTDIAQHPAIVVLPYQVSFRLVFLIWFNFISSNYEYWTEFFYFYFFFYFNWYCTIMIILSVESKFWCLNFCEHSHFLLRIINCFICYQSIFFWEDLSVQIFWYFFHFKVLLITTLRHSISFYFFYLFLICFNSFQFLFVSLFISHLFLFISIPFVFLFISYLFYLFRCLLCLYLNFIEWEYHCSFPPRHYSLTGILGIYLS